MVLSIAVVGCRGFGRVHLNALFKLRDKYGLELYVFSRTEEYARDCYREYQGSIRPVATSLGIVTCLGPMSISWI